MFLSHNKKKRRNLRIMVIHKVLWGVLGISIYRNRTNTKRCYVLECLCVFLIFHIKHFDGISNTFTSMKNKFFEHFIVLCLMLWELYQKFFTFDRSLDFSYSLLDKFTANKAHLKIVELFRNPQHCLHLSIFFRENRDNFLNFSRVFWFDRFRQSSTVIPRLKFIKEIGKELNESTGQPRTKSF